jgi:hypothetical protein
LCPPIVFVDVVAVFRGWSIVEKEIQEICWRNYTKASTPPLDSTDKVLPSHDGSELFKEPHSGYKEDVSVELGFSLGVPESRHAQAPN